MTCDYKKMKEIEAMTEGDVARSALRLAQEKRAPEDWALRQIERGIGNVAGSVHTLLQHNCVHSEWAMERIERATDDMVSATARYMAIRGMAPVEWAKKQIERGLGDTPYAAYQMANDGLATPEWAIKLIEKHTGESILFWDRGE